MKPALEQNYLHRRRCGRHQIRTLIDVVLQACSYFNKEGLVYIAESPLYEITCGGKLILLIPNRESKHNKQIEQ